MINTNNLLFELKSRGFNFFTGVPCSFLKPFINSVIDDPDISYVGASSEGEAVAIASGAWLAGKESVLMCQNSGLGNTINPLTSLNYPFQIPILLFVTWRGQPGLKDEPQHELMGEITDLLLNDIRLGFTYLPSSDFEVGPSLDLAQLKMHETNLPYAFIVKKGAISNYELNLPQISVSSQGMYNDLRKNGKLMTRYQSLERIVEIAPENAGFIATTGKCGRELFSIEDREQHLYQVGSMGCASAMGLGVALNVEESVVILDGDGAALMKMGSFATIGANSPKNLLHIVLDNGVHDSTGGQPTVSYVVDFASVALACGYKTGTIVDDIGCFTDACLDAFSSEGPHMIQVKIEPGSITKLGRPKVKPHDIARRFKKFLTDKKV